MRRMIRTAPVVLVAASLVALFSSRRGESVPLYAARTGLMCQSCHFDPNGGGPRNEFGFAFARNRHRLEAEDSTSAWHDLTLTNRVGENFPLYFGVNQRFMFLVNTTLHSDSLDRAGFYSMENSFHIAFQPHAKLTLVYSRDGFDASSSTKEAFGMIGGLPLDGYLKAGRFRTPFGLRLDDHTVATRNGFLDIFAPTAPFNYFGVGDSVTGSFLPYDPRQPDMGVEVGATHGGFFGRASFTDGESEPLTSNNLYADAKTIKVGYNSPYYQGAISFYDDYRRLTARAPLPASERKRATRWGYYGLTHYGPLAALGEIAAGTDELPPPLGLASGAKQNLLAWWAELDYAPVRQANVRVRYDRMSLNRGAADPYIRDLNSHQRASLEAEWVPVPFAELRWSLRRIHHDASEFRNFFGAQVPIKDETQSFVQFHFSF